MNNKGERTDDTSELHLRAVFESMDSLFILVDPQLRIVTLNRAMADGLKKIFGREPVPGDLYLDFILEENRAKAENYIIMALAGENLEEEWQASVPTRKEKIWLSVTHHPVLSDAGQVIGAAVHYRNIDRIKSAEQDSMEKEQQLNAVLESMFTSFAFFDKELNLVRCSAHFRKQVKMFLGKFVQAGTHASEYLHADNAKVVIANMQQALAGEEVETEGTFYNQLTGEQVWVKQYYYPVYGTNRELLGVAYHGLNMDDQKKVEFQLRSSYERLTTVLKASHDAVWEMDLRSGVVTRNENFALLFGYEPEAVNQRFDWWQQHIHEEDKASILNMIEDAIRNKKPQVSLEYRFRCLNGHYKYVKDSFCMLFDDNGEPYRLVGSMQDIDRLQTQKQTLLKQNMLLRDFAFVQSHMIRKPVANISGLFELMNGYLKQQSTTDKELGLYLEQLHRSIIELDLMVQESISKINNLNN